MRNENMFSALLRKIETGWDRIESSLINFVRSFEHQGHSRMEDLDIIRHQPHVERVLNAGRDAANAIGNEDPERAVDIGVELVSDCLSGLCMPFTMVRDTGHMINTIDSINHG